jgi:hypothetical protein
MDIQPAPTTTPTATDTTAAAVPPAAPPPVPAPVVPPVTAPSSTFALPAKFPLFVLGGLFFIAVIAIGFLSFQNSKLSSEVADLKKPTPVPTKAIPTVTPTPIDPKASWKMYQGTNFEITYPPTGMGQTGTNVACGTAILASGTQLQFENYFAMNTVTWNKTIKEWIALQGEAGTFNLISLSIPNADEAVQIGTRLKVPKKAWNISYVLKKGSQLLTFSPRSPIGEGCIPDQVWKLEENFRFTAASSVSATKK